MIDRSGPLAFLGALGLAGLAVGLGVGAHALIGSPTSTPEQTGPGASSTIEMSDDFCTLMDEMVAFTDEWSASSSDTSFMMDESTWDDPAILDAIHEEGQSSLDAIVPVTAYLHHGGELATDPAAAAAFGDLAVAVEAQLTILGRAALDATSVEGYMTAIFGMMVDADAAAASSDADAAIAIVQPYIAQTCGRDILAGDLFGNTSTDVTVDIPDVGVSTAETEPTDPEEAAAWTDATTVGTAIEAYYVDWAEGDPQAEVTVTGGSYFLLGTEIGPVTDGNVITSQTADGPEDWCVEVTPNGDSTKTYSYEAFWGIWPGACS